MLNYQSYNEEDTCFVELRMSRLDIALLTIALASLAVLAFRHVVSRTTVTSADDKSGVELSRFVEDIRKQFEVMEQVRISENRASSIPIKSFDLEVSFVVKNRRNAKGEVKYELITVGEEVEKLT